MDVFEGDENVKEDGDDVGDNLTKDVEDSEDDKITNGNILLCSAIVKHSSFIFLLYNLLLYLLDIFYIPLLIVQSICKSFYNTGNIIP